MPSPPRRSPESGCDGSGPVDDGRPVPERAEALSHESEEASAAAQPASLAALAPGVVLALQRSAGNRAVAGLIARAAVARDTDTWSKDYKSKKTRQGLTLDANNTRRRSGPRTRRSTRPRSRRRASGVARRSPRSRSGRPELGAIVVPEVKDPAGLAAHEQAPRRLPPVHQRRLRDDGDRHGRGPELVPRPRRRVRLVRADDRDRRVGALLRPVHRPRPDPGDVGGRLRAGDRLRRGARRATRGGGRRAGADRARHAGGHAAARARRARQGGQDGDQGRHHRGRQPEVHVPVLRPR